MTLSSRALSSAWASTPSIFSSTLPRLTSAPMLSWTMSRTSAHHGDLRVQVLDLEVDLVDLDDRDVEEDIGPVGDVPGSMIE